jgi:hypothetical protein
MVGGEDFFKDKKDDFSSGGSSSFGPISSDKVSMIERVFNEVLGRKPTGREIAYYKYGVLDENGIRNKLLKSKEHQQLIEDALKLPGVEEELKTVRVSERKLSQIVSDLNEEMLESESLLREKNFLISELRQKVNNPYNFPSEMEKFEEGFDIKTKVDRIQLVPKKSFKEKLIDLIETFF